MPSHRRKEVEDPDNTWNMQLMAAVLAGEVSTCESLIAKGADPVKAREVTPFSNGGRLSPLAALLLMGSLTEGHLAVAQCLMRCGARVDDMVPLPTPTLPSTLAMNASTTTTTPAAAAALDDAAGGRRPVSPREMTRSGSSAGGAGGLRNAGTSLTTTAASSPPAPAAAAAAGHAILAMSNSAPHAPAVRMSAKELEAAMAASDCGTVLHYVVAVGDHAHLLQLLVVLGERADRPVPQSLLPEVEREMALPLPPSSAFDAEDGVSKGGAGAGRPMSPSRTNSRAGRSKSQAASSMSRRQSRVTGLDKKAQQHEAELAAAGARYPLVPSPLPRLTQHPWTSTSPDAPPAHPSGRAREPIRLLPCEGEACGGEGSQLTLDLEKRTTQSRLTALELAVRNRDVLSIRLLTYYGARGLAVNPTPLVADNVACVNGYVNGMQTALARACSLGDVATMEMLLDAGDSLSQLSHDGRYTLMHFAVGQPAALQYLVRRGLSGDAENAFGETALVSLIRHGTGRNANYACKEAPCASDAAKLAALPTCVLRNYILTPLPPLMPTGKAGKDGGAAGAASAACASSARLSIAGGGGGRSVNRTATQAQQQQQQQQAPSAALTPRGHAARNIIGGGGETGTWFSFTALPTADLIHNILVHGGASVNGFVPDDELELAHVQFAEEEERGPGHPVMSGHTQEPHTGGVDGSESGPVSGHTTGGVRQAASLLRGSGSRSPSPSSNRSPTAATAAAAAMWNGSGLAAAATVRKRTTTATAALQPARLPLRATPLMHAILNYHPELIRKFAVEYRADVMARDSCGACALHYAAQSPHLSVMELLLSPLVVNAASTTSAAASTAAAAVATATPGGSSGIAPININVADMAGRTPLHYAAAVGNTAVMKLLLGMGTLVLAGKPDVNGYTPLHLAVLANSTSCVEVLVRHSEAVMASLFGVNHPNSNFLSAGGGMASMNMMMMTGGNIVSNASFGGGSNATAGGGGKRATVVGGTAFAHVGSAGGSSSRHRRGSNANSSTGRSALSHQGSAHDGFAAAGVVGGGGGIHEHMVVDTESEDARERATPLQLAVTRQADAAIVRRLLSEGSASLHRPSGLDSGGSLLHRAVADDAVDVVTILLEHYADPNEVDEEDRTPLLLAVDRPSSAVCVEVVEKLLRFGALPNAQSGVKLTTPLHVAAARGHPTEVLSLLFFDPTSAAAAPPTRTTSAEPFASSSTTIHTNTADKPTPGEAATSAATSGGGGGGASAAAVRRMKERLAAAQRPTATTTTTPLTQDAATTEGGAATMMMGGVGVASGSTNDLAERQGGVASPEAPLDNRRLIPEPHLFLTDAKGRTPFQLLCSQSERDKQENVLFLLKAILCRRRGSDEESRGVSAASTRMGTHHGGGGGAEDAKELGQRLCLCSDARGRLPLHDACQAVFPEAVALLLAAAPSTVFAVSGESGSTALHEAVSTCYYTAPTSSSSSLLAFAPAAAAKGTSDGDAQGGDAARAGAEEEEEERRAQRQERGMAVFANIARVVQAQLPAKLTGYAASTLPARPTASHYRKGSSSSRHNALVRGSITEQLKRSSSLVSGACFGVRQPPRRENVSPAAAVVVVSSMAQYMQLTDHHGRTALLLAGERGDVAASHALLQMWHHQGSRDGRAPGGGAAAVAAAAMM